MLPPKVLDEAKKSCYDNNNPKNRIYGLSYQGKIYLIHENIYSVKDIEEALLHERTGQGADAFIKNAVRTKKGG